MNVLFVCTGNTCRSPMAEHLFRKLAADAGLKATVRSAGVAPAIALTLPVEAALALAEEGVRGVRHQPQGLETAGVEEADVIFVMEPAHRAALLRVFPGVEAKVHVLKRYAGLPGPESVADPFGGDEQEYRRALADIKAALQKIINQWSTGQSPRPA